MSAEGPAQLSLELGAGAAPAPGPASRGGPATTEEQRAAIDSRGRDVFCEAGAGTGKTRVLVERYCDALALDGTGREAILAFTFTERAAAELRARIRAELAARASSARELDDSEAAAALGRAARETEAAWVMTIHGFCHRLLASHPVTAGLDPRFRVLDEAEASRIRARARDLAIEDVLGAGDEERAEILGAYRPQRIGDIAVAAHERLRSMGVASPALPPPGDPVASAKGGEQAGELSAAEIRGARGAHAALTELLAAFHRRYEELKARRSGLDFTDLELRALELLEAPGPIAEAWRGRFEHVMVDEFQDTNEVQLALVEALRGPETRVFRVGDELQSIYRFRNADLEVFRAERLRAAGDPATLVQPLTGNFRSRPGVIGAVNFLGSAVLGDAHRPLVPRRPEHGDGPAAELLLTLDEGRANGWAQHAEELRLPASETQARIVAEARALARRLRDLVDAGEAEPGGIVVLLRAYTHVDAYEEALARAGLDPYVAGGRGYWSQQQVEDVLRLLEAVANPLDDEMLLGALAGPAGGVSPDALWLLRRATRPATAAQTNDAGSKDGERSRRASPGHLWPVIDWRFGSSERRPQTLDEQALEALPAADARLLEAFSTRLGELRAAAPLLALDELVERTMTAFDYDLALLARDRGRARMANVRKLIRMAGEFEAHEGRDLRGFLTAAAELTRRDEREGLAATQAEDHDGVRIMTVHAAKGLEFPVVAVPDLSRALAEGERPGDLALGRPALASGRRGPARFGLRVAAAARASYGAWDLHELHSESVAEAAEEGARVVHVAATRAEERLILSGVFKPADCDPRDPGPRDSPLQRLLPALAARGWAPGADGEVALPPPPSAAVDGERPPGPSRLAVSVSAPGAERARLLAERLEPRPAAPRPDEAAGPPPLGRPRRVVPTGHLSYSALDAYERCAYRFYVERLLGLDAPDGTPRREPGEPGASDPAARGAGDPRGLRLGLGNAVHAALEWSARHAWERPPREDLAALLAGERVGEDPELVDRALALVDGWLGSELRARVGDAELRPEVAFAIEIAGTLVRGQIDLLALGDEPVVIDYKTDALGGSSPAEAGGRYAAQRELYALAAAEASGGGADTVLAAHCFLEAPAEPVSQRFDPAGLADARTRLERVIAEIRESRFEPTSEPSPQVCNGCPAAARLCPHPAWRPAAARGAAAP